MPPWWSWVVHDVLEPLQTYPITASVNLSVCVGVGWDSSKSVTVCFNDVSDINHFIFKPKLFGINQIC